MTVSNRDLRDSVDETLRRAKECAKPRPSGQVENPEGRGEAVTDSAQVELVVTALNAQEKLVAKLQKRLTDLRWERRRIEKKTQQYRQRLLELEQEAEMVTTAIGFAERQTQEFVRQAQRCEEQLGKALERRKRVAQSVLATHDVCERLSTKLQNIG